MNYALQDVTAYGSLAAPVSVRLEVHQPHTFGVDIVNVQLRNNPFVLYVGDEFRELRKALKDLYLVIGVDAEVLMFLASHDVIFERLYVTLTSWPVEVHLPDLEHVHVRGLIVFVAHANTQDIFLDVNRLNLILQLGLQKLKFLGQVLLFRYSDLFNQTLNKVEVRNAHRINFDVFLLNFLVDHVIYFQRHIYVLLVWFLNNVFQNVLQHVFGEQLIVILFRIINNKVYDRMQQLRIYF